MNLFAQNYLQKTFHKLLPFFRLAKISHIAFDFRYTFHPWWRIKMYHKKSEAKSKICWLGWKKVSLGECQRFFSRSALNSSLFSCPSIMNVRHTIFLSLYADWKLFLFISTKFSTHHMECWRLPTGLFNTWNEIIIHNFNTFSPFQFIWN